MDIQMPIVPFGKYKDQPLTNLLSDKEYLEWCKKQEFLKKFPIIYNICVNQTITTNNSKTPEHNKLQNKFLDKENKFKLLNILAKNTISKLINISNTDEFKKCFYNDNTTNLYDIIHFGKIEFESKFNWDFVFDPRFVLQSNKDNENIEFLKYKTDYLVNFDKYHTEIFEIIKENFVNIQEKKNKEYYIDLEKNKLDIKEWEVKNKKLPENQKYNKPYELLERDFILENEGKEYSPYNDKRNNYICKLKDVLYTLGSEFINTFNNWYDYKKIKQSYEDITLTLFNKSLTLQEYLKIYPTIKEKIEGEEYQYYIRYNYYNKIRKNYYNNMFKGLNASINYCSNEFKISIDMSIIGINVYSDRFDYDSKIYAEIKPLLGDDYPCVLRKLKTQIEFTRKSISKDYIKSYLIIDKFESSSATKEQLITIFNQTNINILFADDIFNELPKQTLVIYNNNDFTLQNKLLHEELLILKEKVTKLEEENKLLKNELIHKEDIKKEVKPPKVKKEKLNKKNTIEVKQEIKQLKYPKIIPTLDDVNILELNYIDYYLCEKTNNVFEINKDEDIGKFIGVYDKQLKKLILVNYNMYLE